MKIIKFIFIILWIFSFSGISSQGEEPAERKDAAGEAQTVMATPLPTALSVKNASLNEKTEVVPSEASIQAMQSLLKKKYAPPLSLLESIRLTDNVAEIIEPAFGIYKEPRKEKSLQLMNLVIDHVKLKDDRASSLLFYRWYYIGRNRVIGDQIQEKIFKPQPILKNVTAISFEAEREDVHIHFMKVTDLEDAATSFKIDKWILKNVPRKEVCFLYFPTTIKQILLDYSTKTDAWGRISVYAGVTDRPEFGKAALYYLTTARKEIEGGSFEKAKMNLQKAKEQLIKFNRQISLESP
ncbi:hypothetical protein JW926_08600 [Candidatus Sumerlaeota bacterium]|nr:hypothetical protein [Candidatus Sumerlaeota bacterium]